MTAQIKDKNYNEISGLLLTKFVALWTVGTLNSIF